MASFSPTTPPPRSNPFDKDSDSEENSLKIDDILGECAKTNVPEDMNDEFERKDDDFETTAITPSDVETAAALSRGFLAHVLPRLDPVKASVEELLTKQESVLRGFRRENQRFRDSDALTELQQRLSRVKTYHEKLVHIRRTMTSLHERTTRLKRRATRLQMTKQKEALARAVAVDKEREREKKLVARTDSQTPSP